jgi:hypothetical protein
MPFINDYFLKWKFRKTQSQRIYTWHQNFLPLSEEIRILIGIRLFVIQITFNKIDYIFSLNRIVEFILTV